MDDPDALIIDMKYAIVFALCVTFLGLEAPLVSSEPFRPSRLTEVDKSTVLNMLNAPPPARAFFHIVDLRREVDYRKQHISGAVNIPYSKIDFVVEKIFSRNDKIVLYGNTNNDPSSVNAAVRLMNRGYGFVAVLKGGFKEWDGPVECLSKS